MASEEGPREIGDREGQRGAGAAGGPGEEAMAGARERGRSHRRQAPQEARRGRGREQQRACRRPARHRPARAFTHMHKHCYSLAPPSHLGAAWSSCVSHLFTVSTDGEAAAGRAQVVIQACVAQLSQPPDCSGRCRWVPGNSLSTQGHGQGGGHAD